MNWVRTSERLPEIDQYVLTAGAVVDEQDQFTEWNIDLKQFTRQGFVKEGDWLVTNVDSVEFWMPLPEPPNK